MIRTSGACAFSLRTIAAVGAMTRSRNCVSGNSPAQLSKSCTTSTPWSICRHRQWLTASTRTDDQPGKALGLPPGPGPGPLAVGAALAFDHVEGQGPGRAGKADQRGVGWNGLGQPGDRGIDRGQPLVQPLSIEAGDLLGAKQPLQHRTLAFDETDGAPQRVRDDQDVAEQDGRVHPIAAQRLQRRLDAERRGVAEAEEIRGPPAQLLVLGEIAPGLAEEPERRPIRRLIGEGAQQALAQRTVLPGCVFNNCSDAHIKTLLLREKVAVVVGPWKAGD